MGNNSRYGFVFIKSMCVIGMLALAANYMAKAPLYGWMAVTLLLALPIAAVNVYFMIIAKTRKVLTLKAGGLLSRVLGFRFWLTFILFAISLVASFFMLLQLTGFKPFDWIFIVLTGPVFLLCHRVSISLMKRESVPWLVPARAAMCATWGGAAIMLLIYAIGLAAFGQIPAYVNMNMEEARAAQLIPLTGSSSAFIREISEWSRLLSGYRDVALGRLEGVSHLLALLASVLGYSAFFYSISSLLVFTSIPSHEYRRILLPLTPSPDLPKIPFSTSAVYSAVFTIFMVMVYLPGVAQLELMATFQGSEKQGTAISGLRQRFQDIADPVMQVVLIGTQKYDARVLGEAAKLREKFLGVNEAAKKELTHEINRIFDGYEQNVDNYLDWYYSLGGEYSRITELVKGNIEAYMRDKLAEHMTNGVDNSGLNRIFERYQGSVEAYQKEIDQLLAKYELPADNLVNVVKTMTKGELFVFPDNGPELLGLKRRLGISSAGGIGGGLAVGAITAKVAQKAVYKLAAKAIVKAAAAKGGGILASTAAGAAIGSVVPGAGTAVGTVAGVVTGVVGGLFIEKGLLVLEDHVKRAEFKVEIIQSINEQRQTLLNYITENPIRG